ncbi:acyl-ACP desaturase [Streptomyces cavernae]|uniref:acyl-ACP desaturase n=1 Tax=Streptomyces cavernae TaxID=2259034 RepID=UPI0030B839AA
MTTVPTADIRLLLDLEPVVEAGLSRHLATAKEWFPHEYVPWSRGLDFDGVLGGQAWNPGQSNLPEAVRTSLIVRTAEEDRHGNVIRDYLLATGAVDPVALERARMVHMATGFELEYTGAVEAIAYVSFQELATRVAHRNTGRLSGDPVCDQLLARVAQDENLHMAFYRDLLDATFDLVPDAAMRAVTTVVTSFRMPVPRDRQLGAQVGAVRHGGHLRPPAASRRGALARAAPAAGLRALRSRPGRRTCPC